MPKTHAFYTDLAEYYDVVYLYVDYRRHADAIFSLIQKYKKNDNPKLLDMACGTGTHAKLLSPKGFVVTGVDISENMLAVARKKNPGIFFVRGDMRTFAPKEKFGVVLCFHNAILYNQDEAQMRATLSNFFSALQPGGILVFDAVDKRIGATPKRGEYRFNSSDLNLSFKPQWAYNEKTNRLDLAIDFDVNGKTFHDHHEMGAFTLQELKDHAKNAGFDVFLLQRNFEFPRKEEALFVCRKPL
ncbi:class I SAM-dependent methyltransferase [Candidatus Micrarchaeota archaeon]|nr:class I SAM-dependent methyltransferase [Candidatus Micrarchaeota archaeon]